MTDEKSFCTKETREDENEEKRYRASKAEIQRVH